ncbi:MAG TPA: undecaprenyl-diphosphate phosphatase [Saprospiraceae bacterium]|nr:undecaprenyl-diphosphate phosphatase [Saprospiraceae bacterium]HMP12549.1 undecaprenyl-diphosphate phosphatase [Saprospiraceae bacterium]
MGETINAIILGIVQGLTEFLPVSSSGHLELAKFILGDDKVGQESLLMTVALHVATALSTIVVFRKDIMEIFKGLFQFKWNAETRFAVLVLVSMIPAALVGILLESQIEQLFSKQILLVGTALIATGVLLFLADRARSTGQDIRFLDAFLIGVAQAIAILPGISRSGATISTSVLLGIDREKAARFSFLMVVPLILGKIVKDVLDGELSAEAIHNMLPLLLGFVAAFFSGLFACLWMIQLVKRSKLSYFAVYCFLVGAIAIIFYYYNSNK